MHSQEKSLPGVPLVLCDGYSGDDALSTWRQLAHTYLKLQRKVEEMLVPHGLALSQFEALAKVAMNPGVIQQDLVTYPVGLKRGGGFNTPRYQRV